MIAPFSIARLPRIEFGSGVFRKLPAIAASYGRRLLLVTGARSFLTAPHAAELFDALRQGRVEAYVTDYTLLLNVLSQGTGEAQLAGAPFGPQDPYGIGLPKGSDGVAFVNAFLKKIQADGTWAKLWTVSIGQRTGSTNVPTPPAIQ